MENQILNGARAVSFEVYYGKLELCHSSDTSLQRRFISVSSLFVYNLSTGGNVP